VRAGDVIPEIAGRVGKGRRKRGKSFSMPERCPVCKTEVIKEGAYYFCPNGLSCKAQLKGHLVHFASREAMNIGHLGEEVAEQLIEKDLVKELSDLYELEAKDLQNLDGFAEKSAKNLHRSIQKSKNPRFNRFLHALGIRHVGQHIASLLAEEFNDLSSLGQADYDRLIQIEEIGPKIARSIRDFFKQAETAEALDRLLNKGIHIQQAKKRKSKNLEGITVVFTGELAEFTRNEAEHEVELRGGRTTSSVSGNTDYVVAGKDPGQKIDQARETKTKILDEKAFKKLLDLK
jgi:DNA ligase (NAD+)